MPLTPLAISSLDSLLGSYDVGNASCVPSPVNGSAISACNDLSGNARHMTPTNAIYRAARTPAGTPSVDLSSSGSLVNNAFFTGSDVTIIAVIRLQADGGELWWAGTGSNIWARNVNAAKQAYGANGTDLGVCPLGLDRGKGWHVVISHQGSTVTFPGAYDGTSGTVSTAMAHWWSDMTNTATAQNTAAPATGAEFGIGDRGTSAEIAEIAVVGRKLTLVECARVAAGLAVKHGTNMPTDGAVITLGNSTTALAGGIAATFASYTGAAGLNLSFFNLGIPSGSATTLTYQHAEIQSIVDLYLAAGQKVCITLHTGHNDTYGNVAIGTLQDSFWQTLRSSGVKLVWLTPTPWQNDTGREAGRTIQVDWMRANHATYSDAMVDLAANAYLGAYPRPAMAATYWADDVHPSTPGQDFIASLVAPAVVSQFSGTGGSVPVRVSLGGGFGG